MLGGFGEVHEGDIKTCKKFLSYFTEVISKGRALDCGAGIGRISREVLMPVFDKIDLVDPVEDFLNTAKKQINSDKICKLYPLGL